MSTFDLYALPPELAAWDAAAGGTAHFTWEYDGGHDRLLALYQKGKDKQWDAARRIDWDAEVDPLDILGAPPEVYVLLAGTEIFGKLTPRERQQLGWHQTAWQFSQFLHGEQAAMITAGRIVGSVPGIDAKFYAATQVMDEARHTEIFARFLTEKVGLVYPVNPHLQALLADTLSDSRWDMAYLGMQVLVEGLALAAFGALRGITSKPLPKQILAYVMQDEARHVAFGRLALRSYYAGLTAAELADREQFVADSLNLMRLRLTAPEVWECFGLDPAACAKAAGCSAQARVFREQLFTRIVPCVRDIGLWGPKLQRAYANMGITAGAAGGSGALVRGGEHDAVAERRHHADVAARAAEVGRVIAEAG